MRRKGCYKSFSLSREKFKLADYMTERRSSRGRATGLSLSCSVISQEPCDRCVFCAKEKLGQNQSNVKCWAHFDITVKVAAPAVAAVVMSMKAAAITTHKSLKLNRLTD